MTCIAYKDGIIAGDSAIWSEDVVTGFEKKVFKNSDGLLLGCSGLHDDIVAFQEWFMAGGRGRTPRLDADMKAIIVDQKGRVFGASPRTRMEPRRLAHSDKPGIVIGYGNLFVHGLMAAGKTAEEAVKIACQRVAYARGHVYTEKLDKPPRSR